MKFPELENDSVDFLERALATGREPVERVRIGFEGKCLARGVADGLADKGRKQARVAATQKSADR